MKQQNTEKKLWGVSLLAAIAASLCCITPVLALLSGISGIASAFTWVEPFRPVFITLSVAVLGFAWYQKLKKRNIVTPDCECEEAQKTSFLQSKSFLGIVSVLVVLIIAFPWLQNLAAPEKHSKNLTFTPQKVESITWQVDGMSCTSCEAHIRHDVSKHKGVINVKADHQTGKVTVQFDGELTQTDAVQKAIDATGYQSIDKGSRE